MRVVFVRGNKTYRTWQDRLKKEFRLRGITTIEQANEFSKEDKVRVFLQDKEVEVLPLSQVMEQPKELTRKEMLR